jgi:hypothetical protein
MRFFTVAADVAMGIFAGIFLFALLTRWRPELSTVPVAMIVVAGAILIALFRAPHGSLARRNRS